MMVLPRTDEWVLVRWHGGGRSVEDATYLLKFLPPGEDLKISTVIKIDDETNGKTGKATVLISGNERHQLELLSEPGERDPYSDEESPLPEQDKNVKNNEDDENNKDDENNEDDGNNEDDEKNEDVEDGADDDMEDFEESFSDWTPDGPDLEDSSEEFDSSDGDKDTSKSSSKSSSENQQCIKQQSERLPPKYQTREDIVAETMEKMTRLYMKTNREMAVIEKKRLEAIEKKIAAFKHDVLSKQSKDKDDKSIQETSHMEKRRKETKEKKKNVEKQDDLSKQSKKRNENDKTLDEVIIYMNTMFAGLFKIAVNNDPKLDCPAECKKVNVNVLETGDVVITDKKFYKQQKLINKQNFGYFHKTLTPYESDDEPLSTISKMNSKASIQNKKIQPYKDKTAKEPCKDKKIIEPCIDKKTTNPCKDKKTAESCKNKKIPENGKDKKTTESSKDKKTLESCKDKKTLESCKNKKTPENSKDKKTTESSKDKKTLESCKNKKTLESCKDKKTLESCKDKKTLESCKDKKTPESCKDKKTLDPCKDKKILESCKDKKTLESCKDKKTPESCKDKKTLDSCKDKKILESCKDKKTLESCKDKKTPESCKDKKTLDPCKDKKTLESCRDKKTPESCKDKKTLDPCKDKKTLESCKGKKTPESCKDKKTLDPYKDKKTLESCKDKKTPEACKDKKIPESCKDKKTPDPCKDKKTPTSCNDKKRKYPCKDKETPASYKGKKTTDPCKDNKIPASCKDNKTTQSCKDKRTPTSCKYSKTPESSKDKKTLQRFDNFRSSTSVESKKLVEANADDYTSDFDYFSDRSDDPVLISNKYKTIDTYYKPESEWIQIGSGTTLIHKDKFAKVSWKSYTKATRTLLLAAFTRRTLATHSLTGKKSPAFLHKPAKMCLDPKIVSDIVIEVADRFHVKDNLVRSIITTKCADEGKMRKMRIAKKALKKAKLAVAANKAKDIENNVQEKVATPEKTTMVRKKNNKKSTAPKPKRVHTKKTGKMNKKKISKSTRKKTQENSMQPEEDANKSFLLENQVNISLIHNYAKKNIPLSLQSRKNIVYENEEPVLSSDDEGKMVIDEDYVSPPDNNALNSIEKLSPENILEPNNTQISIDEEQPPETNALKNVENKSPENILQPKNTRMSIDEEHKSSPGNMIKKNENQYNTLTPKHNTSKIKNKSQENIPPPVKKGLKGFKTYENKSKLK